MRHWMPERVNRACHEEWRRRVREEAHQLKEKVLKHRCHWPTGTIETPPRMWGCKRHWFRLPKILRDKVWATYRPGQEITKDPSRAYIEVIKEVEAFAKQEIAAGRDVACAMIR